MTRRGLTRQEKGDAALFWTPRLRLGLQYVKKDSRPLFQGLTLFEIMLVLALLVVIAGVVTPAISKSISRARLTSAGETVRAAWGKARLAAMQAGEAYVFRYEEGGSRYQIAPLAAITGEDAGDLNTLPPLTEEDEEYLEADMLRLSKSRLPTDIVFSTGRVAAVPQMAGPAVTAEGGWSQPIMFYPDGTTSDAAVLIANPERETIRVTLRGLTGITRASDVGHEEQL